MSAPETPNQLATDRATLAQEEEDSVQQQDNDEIGMLMYFWLLELTVSSNNSCTCCLASRLRFPQETVFYVTDKILVQLPG